MKRRGFTLLEVLVALTLGALVVLVGHRLFSAITDGTHRLSEARDALDRSSNARRWLVEAFGSLDVGTAESGGFAGRPDRVEFGTWLLNERGWFERRRVVLNAEGGALVARLGGGSVVLAESVGGVRFDYLLDPGSTATWVQEWLSPISPPLAVRLRIARRERVDTLLYVVGTRG